MPIERLRFEDAGAQSIVQLLNQLERQGYAHDDLCLVLRAYEGIVPLCTCQFKSSGRTMADHVVHTASLAASSAAPAPFVAATVMHAVYLHGDFGTAFRRVDEAKRTRVRSAVGDEAEDIVFRYHSLVWKPYTIPGIRDRLPSLGPRDRDALRVRLFDQLELFGARDTLFAHNASKRQRYARDFGPMIAAMANEVGIPDLPAAIDGAFASVRDGQLPAALTSPAWREGLFVPLSFRMRPRIALYQSLRWKLWSAIGR